MTDEVLDSNVLTIASALSQGWGHPRVPLRELQLIQKVFLWVTAFRDDDQRRLVLDVPGGAILAEYKSARNMPDASIFGRRVIQHKIDRGLIRTVELSYIQDGERLVAELPDEICALIHDNDDRKMVAAAFAAGTHIVNACDSDWTNPSEQEALEKLGVKVVQILSDAERQLCRGEARRG